MSLSNDEEDDFQSADEDGFDDSDKESSPKHAAGEAEEKPKSASKLEEDSPMVTEPEVKQSSASKLERSPSLSELEQKQEPEQEKQQKQTAKNDYTEDDDNEEGLAEQIRERNIKLARKFSAELAKSVKASAPIPVKTEPPIGFKVDDIEYPDIPDSDKKIRQPLAPPPTPALSSSFSATEDPNSASTPESSGTQYGWRVPIKTPQTPTSTTPTTTTATVRQPDPPVASEINQARAALDRLSDNYTETDKSLFQKVADDLKKVSIKSEDPTIAGSAQQQPATGPALPSLASLGQSFGGWNWNSASRILASASEVTSQVSSVLDSVVNAPRAGSASQQQTSGEQHAPNTSNQPGASSHQAAAGGPKASMSASDASMSNDALVDLTLNAMESLGKKAFGAMTHRDETGSLQIKGLGRPWEQLLNIAKPQQQAPSEQDHYGQPSVQPARSSGPGDELLRNADKTLDEERANENKNASVRRRVVNYDDSDKLD